jgi:ABC-type nitrate/sulfonate/bicarbonate transport system substrate-binding protein
MRKIATRRGILGAMGASICLAGSGAVRGQGNDAIAVNTFPGVTNLPIFAAEENGLLAKYRLTVNLTFTPNSRAQRDGLEKGEYQIIQTAADNSVAMVELDKASAAIVAGGDNGFNHIVVQPEINRLADVRGKTVVVDAPNTAFALLLYKALKESGLGKADYKVNPVGATGARLTAMTNDKSNVAGILNVPFNFRAVAAGLKDLGTAYAAVGPYQSDSIVVMRDWAAAHRDTVVRYIKAVVEGRRWRPSRALHWRGFPTSAAAPGCRTRIAPDAAWRDRSPAPSGPRCARHGAQCRTLATDAPSSLRRRSPRSRNAPCSWRTFHNGRCHRRPSPSSPSVP